MKIYRISFSRTSRNAFDHFCSGLDEVTEKQIPKLKCQYDPETGMIFCWYCLSPIMPEQISCECQKNNTFVTVFGDLDNLTRRYTWGMLNPQKIKTGNIAHNIRTARSVLESVLCHLDAREQLGETRCHELEDILTA